MDDFLIFGSPQIEQPEIDDVVDSLESGWLGTGPKVARFEKAFRDYKGAGYAVAVSSAYLRELDSASIFLHPSVVSADGDTEGGAPTVLLEAQAMGLPVVSTLHADIPNVTVPGKSALLVAERDADAIAEVLVALLDDPSGWAAMGRAGRRHVESYHDIHKEAPALEERYRSLLSADPKAASDPARGPDIEGCA